MMPRISVPCVPAAVWRWTTELWLRAAPSWSLAASALTLAVCSLLLLAQMLSVAGPFPGVWGGLQAPREAEGLGYAVVVDAGSSGSRAHLYVWPPHTGNRKDLLSIQPLKDPSGQPLLEVITPGLSSMKDTPDRAGAYLRPLLEFAAKHVPQEKHRETPLYIMATAGMRMLAKEEQAEIVSHLRKYIKQHYDFLLAENNIQVITGREEGIYQWIAINFALGRFRHAHDGPVATVETVGEEPVRRLRTVGALDMGGASMQIGFEVTTREQQKALERHRSSMALINLGCADHDREHTYRVYVSTFLGYGANEAFRRHSEAVRNRYTNTTRKLYDPCLVREFADAPYLRNGSLCQEKAPPANCSVPVVGTGDWHQCEELVRKQIVEERTTRQCEEGPEGCTRTLQPPPVNLTDIEFYGFSEFWYSMEDTLRSGGKYNYRRFSQTAKDYCGTQWATIVRRRAEGLYGSSDDDRLARQCFKSVYLTAALHTGLGLPQLYQRLTSTPSVVAGRVCTWTLGALLYKLRFLPVRSVEAATFSHISAGVERVWGSQYLLLACVIVVLAVLALYILRLRRLRRRPRVRLASEREPMLSAVRVS